jgi:hypothetical protein
MASDPCEVMGLVIAQEWSLISSLRDEELLSDAQSIAEAEQRRTRVLDRLEAACGQQIHVRLAGGCVSGTLRELGAGVLLLEGEHDLIAVGSLGIISLRELPPALRREGTPASPLPITWPSILRRHFDSVPVRMQLADGCQLRGLVESVGADHLDVRELDGTRHTVMFTGISMVIRTR